MKDSRLDELMKNVGLAVSRFKEAPTDAKRQALAAEFVALDVVFNAGPRPELERMKPILQEMRQWLLAGELVQSNDKVDNSHGSN
jgi:hypothetical protein